MNTTHATASIVLVGVGGQGILLASEIIARAALSSGLQVKTNEVHGMAQRGGSVMAQIRYGDQVNSPLVAEGACQALASFEKIEGLRYAHYLAPGGLAVVSTQELIPVTVSSGQASYPDDAEERLRRAFPRLVYLDAASIATTVGNIRAANVVILGALSKGMSLSVEAWKQAVAESVKSQHRDLNLAAFAAGRQAADAFRDSVGRSTVPTRS